MLPDLSPAHILIVVVVALIVVGPKDLPMLLRKIGQFMGKMRTMANEFRASFDEMARQSELDELRKEVESMRAAANAETEKIAYSTDFGITDALKSDAEGAAMHEWMGPGLSGEADHSILPPPEAAKTKVAKTKTAAPKGKSAKVAPKASAKPASKPAAKAKAAVASAKADPKPRAKKTKSASEAAS
jgi:sec-independent protein translocase protein TatB